ncbi:E3 ubiquitin/ISG15 ligase TRIM25-like [Mantella aurantiaca]
MASADLRAELECSVCLNIYTDPVNLKCGHSFCRVCIDRVLDTQRGSGEYSCPECRQKFQDQPALQNNRNLRNISENFKFAELGQEQSEGFCTHCVDSPEPAVRSCLHCEVSLCDKHLRVHKKSPEHILTDPTSSLESRKCSVHKKILEYYCTEDHTCVCVACTLADEHRGHQVQMLDEASGKKKETLRNVLQKLVTTRKETEERVRSLQEHRRKVEEEAAGDTERVTALFIDLRRHLEVLEKRALREISGWAERDSISIMIRDLEIKKDELSRKMRHIEELCNMTDPLTVLQESGTGDLCDTEVLSSQSLSSGRHYWEVDVGGSDGWIVGICYPSMARRGGWKSLIGYNGKSWGLYKNSNQYEMRHDSNKIPLLANISSNRIKDQKGTTEEIKGVFHFAETPAIVAIIHTRKEHHPVFMVNQYAREMLRDLRILLRHMLRLRFSCWRDTAMASADLRAELECSVCLNIYNDPVMLKCGHNFCQVCIDRVLDTQGGSGGYSCPECREEFQDRSALHKNITLRTITGYFQSAEPCQEQSGVFCSHCVDSPVPAVRSCLLCEVSLCDKHLRVHKKSPEHILTDPTSSLKSRKCSVHKEVLKYFCSKDHICVCMSCFAIGGHKGHEMESLDEASGKKKETLRNVKQKLVTTREKTEERVRSLQEHRRKVEEEAAGDTERVTALFIDLRRRLEDLEKRVLREISGRAERDSMSIVEMIRDLEIKKDELSRKMRHIEELCNVTDPLTVLQESDTGDLCDTEDGDDEDRERHDKLLHDGGDLDVAGILHTGLSDIITEVNVYFPIQEAADILLDVNTAHNDLHISVDMKTVSWSDIKQNRPETPERFQDCYQVLSSRSFSSGRHYWEVDVGGSDDWIVGMCYPSIDRRGWQSRIGSNEKSWGLDRYNNQYLVRHDSNKILLPANISSNRVRIYLDYEAGRISFYDLCDPIQHLHTFTTPFTEPLHAGICVWEGCIKICGGNRGM